MADLSKLVFVNASGDIEESKTTDSLQYTSFKTADYELDNSLLGNLVNAITATAGAADAGKFMKTGASGKIDASFLNEVIGIDALSDVSLYDQWAQPSLGGILSKATLSGMYSEERWVADNANVVFFSSLGLMPDSNLELRPARNDLQIQLGGPMGDRVAFSYRNNTLDYSDAAKQVSQTITEIRQVFRLGVNSTLPISVQARVREYDGVSAGKTGAILALSDIVAVGDQDEQLYSFEFAAPYTIPAGDKVRIEFVVVDGISDPANEWVELCGDSQIDPAQYFLPFSLPDAVPVPGDMMIDQISGEWSDVNAPLPNAIMPMLEILGSESAVSERARLIRTGGDGYIRKSLINLGLGDLSNVDLGENGPADGYALRYNGTQFVSEATAEDRSSTASFTQTYEQMVRSPIGVTLPDYLYNGSFAANVGGSRPFSAMKEGDLLAARFKVDDLTDTTGTLEAKLYPWDGETKGTLVATSAAVAGTAVAVGELEFSFSGAALTKGGSYVLEVSYSAAPTGNGLGFGVFSSQDPAAPYIQVDFDIEETVAEVNSYGQLVRSRLADGYIDETFLSALIARAADVMLLDGSQAMAGDMAMGGNKITGMADGTANSDAATYGQLLQLSNGLTRKRPARAASTANVDLATGGLLTIDGVVLADGDRVLVKDQTVASENGIYVAAAGAWVRSADFDEPSEVVSSVIISVSEGTVQQNTSWMLVSDDPLTLGTSDLLWDKWYITDIDEGNGIAITGDQVAVRLAADKGLQFDGNAVAAKVDDSTIGVDATGLFVKDLGVTTAKLAATSVTAAKLGSDVAGDGMTGGNGSALAIDWASVALDDKAWKASQLSASAGAGYIGYDNTTSGLSASTVKSAIDEVAALAASAVGVTYVASGAIAAGDLVYITSDGKVAKYSDITVASFIPGVAASSVADGANVEVLADDQVEACLTGQTPGAKQYWDGSGWVTSIPTTAGGHVYRGGAARTATDLHVQVEFVKKNAA